MYDWSSLTDALIATLTTLGELPSDIHGEDLDAIYQVWFRREAILDFRDAYAIMRGVPSIFD